jgi:hypothetical protein
VALGTNPHAQRREFEEERKLRQSDELST